MYFDKDWLIQTQFYLSVEKFSIIYVYFVIIQYMKKKILATMMTLGFISSVLAAPAGLIIIDDPKIPVDSIRMPVDGERPMPKPKIKPPTQPGLIIIDDPKIPVDSIRMPVDGERPMPKPKMMPPHRDGEMRGAVGSDTPSMMDDMSSTTKTKHGIDNNHDKRMGIVEGDMGSNKNQLRRNMDNMFCDLPPRAPEEYMMASNTMPDLKFGDGNKNGKGMHVKILQARLIEGGYLSGTTTGNFGALTREAVKKYQKDIGIAKPTGLFGMQTKQKIRAKCTPLNDDSGDNLPDKRHLPM